MDWEHSSPLCSNQKLSGDRLATFDNLPSMTVLFLRSRFLQCVRDVLRRTTDEWVNGLQQETKLT
jgi:hypothetical protein